jgi:hypothetical protein
MILADKSAMVETIKAWQCIGCGRVAGSRRSTPREGQWERSYLALRREARALLGL